MDTKSKQYLLIAVGWNRPVQLTSSFSICCFITYYQTQWIIMTSSVALVMRWFAESVPSTIALANVIITAKFPCDFTPHTIINTIITLYSSIHCHVIEYLSDKINYLLQCVKLCQSCCPLTHCIMITLLCTLPVLAMTSRFFFFIQSLSGYLLIVLY